MVSDALKAKMNRARASRITNYHSTTALLNTSPSVYQPSASFDHIESLIRPTTAPQQFTPALRRIPPNTSHSPSKAKHAPHTNMTRSHHKHSLSASNAAALSSSNAVDLHPAASLDNNNNTATTSAAASDVEEHVNHLLSAISADSNDVLAAGLPAYAHIHPNTVNPSSSLTTAQPLSHSESKKAGQLRIQSNSSLPTDHFVNRLYTTTKSTPHEENLNESIVSDLPNEALRWIKKRRTMDSNQRVVISYIRDKQLKEMFNRLDFSGHGYIELNELTDAIRYVKEKLKIDKPSSSGAQSAHHFQNLDKVFAEMDDNGDGTVDYQEFTKGMTGTAKSAFDKASQYDVDKLFALFIEYGEMRQRQLAVATIARPTAQRVPPSRVTHTRERDRELQELDNGDLTMYQNFKVLFGEHHGKKTKKSLLADENGTPIAELGKKRAEEDEQLLKRFINSNQFNQYGCVVLDESESITSNSVSTLATANIQAEKLYHDIHEKQRVIRRDRVDDLATDFGILQIQQKMASDRQVDIPDKHSSYLPTITEAHSPNKTNMRPLSSSGGRRPPPVIPSTRVRSDLSIRLQARNEAFELLRNNNSKGPADGLQQPSTSSWTTKMFGNQPASKSPKAADAQASQSGITQASSITQRTDRPVHPALFSRGSFIFT